MGGFQDSFPVMLLLDYNLLMTQAMKGEGVES